MSSVFGYFYQYYWPPNVTFPRLIPDWFRCRELGHTDTVSLERRQTKLASFWQKWGKEKKCLCVVRGLVKQRRTKFVFPFMPGHFHMSPLLSYPSITSHSGQDSCLGLKHIHSSAVHQIAPNTVIPQSSWSRGWMGGRCQRGTVVLLYPACFYGLVTSYLMSSKKKKKISRISTHADRCRISKCRFESEF